MAPSSGRLGLELVELHSRASDHARQIGRQTPQVEAALHATCRERRTGTVHDALDAVLMRCLPDLVAGGEMERIRVVAARGQTQCERQVGWPDVDSVEAGRGANGIE